jgi:hypothetical protein
MKRRMRCMWGPLPQLNSKRSRKQLSRLKLPLRALRCKVCNRRKQQMMMMKMRKKVAARKSQVLIIH